VPCSPSGAIDEEPAVAEARRENANVRDDVGFEALFAQQYSGLVRLAVLLVDSTALAEEVVQDSFARVYERWDRIDDPGAYLRRCVVNRANDVLRRRRLERRTHERAELAEAARDEYLLDALGRLTPRQRAAVVLRFYDGRREAEIAAILGMKLGTVKSTLHRALVQLRTEIER
jgi:RNA polymerase sigma-70 factor (sigma-E family)